MLRWNKLLLLPSVSGVSCCCCCAGGGFGWLYSR
jgi:hypothetical protein